MLHELFFFPELYYIQESYGTSPFSSLNEVLLERSGGNDSAFSRSAFSAATNVPEHLGTARKVPACAAALFTARISLSRLLYRQLAQMNSVCTLTPGLKNECDPFFQLSVKGPGYADDGNIRPF